EEGGERMFALNTRQFLGDDDGRVRALEVVEVELVDGRFEEVPGSVSELRADMVLLAMGFVGPETAGLVEQLGVRLDARGNVERDTSHATSLDGVLVACGARRGQSLIVWAIAEGRSCAAAVDRWLSGSTNLP